MLSRAAHTPSPRSDPSGRAPAAWGRSLLAAAICALALPGAGAARAGGRTQTAAPETGSRASGPAQPPTPEPLPCSLDPVLDADFPDPEIALDPEAGRILVLGTNIMGADGRRLNVPEISAPLPAMAPMSAPRDVLPRLPAWAQPGFTWAPAIAHAAGGLWRLYFTARYGFSGRPCIGVATAADPEGPFSPTSETTPLACPLGEGGAIDPSVFVDADGAEYLLWKTDANCCAGEPAVELERLSPGGLSLSEAGPQAPWLLPEAHQLIRRDQPWEGRVVEAPVLLLRDGRYILFYSAGDYAGETYEVAYATAPSLLGPYAKADRPLLSSAIAGVPGPGGEAVAQGPDGRSLLAFHAWRSAHGRRYRALYFGRIEWGDEGPSYAPTCSLSPPESRAQAPASASVAPGAARP